MKPAVFEHVEPRTIAEAVELLHHHGGEARPLAGGQSLVPMMNFRLAQPKVLVDLNRIPELAYIREQGRHLAIGAMTRTRAIGASDLVRRAAPLLHQASEHIAHLPIRTRGTIGGSLANADPAAEFPAVALALDCDLVLRSRSGERRVPAAHFFTGVMTTALQPDELLVEIVVPRMPPSSGAAFIELSRRRGDFALVGIAAQVTFDGPRIADARLAVCGAGPMAVRLQAAEQCLRGAEPGPDQLQAAAAAAAAVVEPQNDLQASADYRRRLVGVLVGRALAAAIQRARTA